MKYTFTDPSGVAKYNDIGGFFWVIVNNQIRYSEGCRESTEKKMTNFMANNEKIQLAFKMPVPINMENLKVFWQPIFKKLGKESVLIFHTCNYDNVIVVNARKFWMQNFVARNILTMLMRASVCYKSFIEASDNYYILKETLTAFKYFLEGNTQTDINPIHHTHGFYYYFKLKDQAYIQQHLKKP